MDITRTGTAGNDVLTGGAGQDTASYRDSEAGVTVRLDKRTAKGAGADAFVFAPGGGDDTVPDFGNGADTLDLAVFEDIRSVDDLVLEQQADDLVIDLTDHGGGSLTLSGVDREDLADTDFVFFTDDALTLV